MFEEQPNLAAAFGVREACFRFGVSATALLFEGLPVRICTKNEMLSYSFSVQN